MVHHVVTPWRNRRELLVVRRQFYPNGADTETLSPSSPAEPHSEDVVAAQNAAVARVLVWVQRGHCPHMVASTALLMAAVLSDRQSSSRDTPTATSAAAASSAAASAYAAAFARFVTGLLDGQQLRARKLSMHGLAQTVGLPAGFVELRHQVTHEAVPSLRRLRAAARQALAWIWGYYWVHLGRGEDKAAGGHDKEEGGDDTALREALLRVLDNSDAGKALPASVVSRWGEARVLAALVSIGAEEEGSNAGRSLRCIRLSRSLLQGRTGRDASGSASKTGSTAWAMESLDLDAVRETLTQDRLALYQMDRDEEDVAMTGTEEREDETGSRPEGRQEAPVVEEEWPARRPQWKRYEGTWTPRPIGVV